MCPFVMIMKTRKVTEIQMATIHIYISKTRRDIQFYMLNIFCKYKEKVNRQKILENVS